MASFAPVPADRCASRTVCVDARRDSAREASTKIDPDRVYDWSRVHVTGDGCKRGRKREREVHVTEPRERGEGPAARPFVAGTRISAGSKDDEVLVPRPLTVRCARARVYETVRCEHVGNRGCYSLPSPSASTTTSATPSSDRRALRSRVDSSSPSLHRA